VTCDGLGDGAVRAAPGDRPPGQHRAPGRPGKPGEDRQQPRLTDPRLTGDQQQTTLAGLARVQRPPGRRQLGVPADHCHHGGSGRHAR
jgi:hypothetical protein